MANQNQNPIGNNGSLEDCHTNLYALTDIAGIQYKKFISSRDGYVNSLDDPILVLYTKCLQSGILSSWNKVKKDDKSNLSDMSGYIRELWIFWYDGNDPFEKKNITIPNVLKEEDHGNWKNGLTYEIRSILFKALNTNFERYFLSRKFVRMGAWIQMPHSFNTHSESQYGFNMKFFLHGESTICGAIDVRNVAKVRLVTRKDLLECNNHYKKEVLLSPYAVRAYITGRGLKDDDINVRQLEEEWLKYYPLVFPHHNLKPVIDHLNNSRKSSPQTDTQNNPPMFIEITTGNCKMKYPSCLVCIQIENEVDSKPKQKENRKRRFNQIDVPDGHLFSYTARRFSDRILKEIIIPLNKCKRESSDKPQGKHKVNSKPWKYCNPLWKNPCSCKRSLECDNLNRIQSDSVRTDDRTQTFHRKIQNFEIPFTRTLLPKDSNQFDFNSNKQIPVSKLDYSCDRSTSPVNSVPNDPIMPTLSPQLPSTSDPSFQTQFPNNSHQSSSNNTINKLSSNLSLQNDGINFSDFSDKQTNKPITSNYNQSSIANNIINSSTTSMNSRTPPPPSITPSSVMPNNYQNTKNESFVNNEMINTMKTEPADNNFDKKLMDSLPPGIEINQKPVLSRNNGASTGLISVISKRLPDRRPPGLCPLNEHISDIQLFPPMECTPIDCGSGGGSQSLLSNSWLMGQCPEIQSSTGMVPDSSTGSSPAAKKLRSLLNYSRSGYTSYYPVLPPPPPQIHQSNSHHHHQDNSKSHSHRGYDPVSSSSTNSLINECKNEKTSLIPDQIFDDSDSDDQRSQDPITTSSSNNNNNIKSSHNIGTHDKILSPGGNCHVNKSLRQGSSHYGKYGGTSLLSSGGSGCVTALELSLMYPTPPSLEGAITAIGSPAERQTCHPMLATSSGNINGRSNAEYNHNETMLSNLSMYCQNWDDMDKDWSTPPVNTALFSSGSKYTKRPEAPRIYRLLSFNHKRLQYQRNTIKNKMADRIMQNTGNSSSNNVSGHNRRPTNLGGPGQLFYPQQPSFVNPPPAQCLRYPNGSSRLPMSSLSGHNSGPMTPASACTNPPSVESSMGAGTPRNVSQDYCRPPLAVQCSPVTTTTTAAAGQRSSPRAPLSTPGTHTAVNNNSQVTVNSLYFNVLLSDSILNVYKDHNFDSCNICVCTMSVQGNDVGLYLDDYQTTSQSQTPMMTMDSLQHQQSLVNRSLSADDLMNGSCSSRDCKCGFSAVMNRHYAVNGNLFYEDEVEITGVRRPHSYSTMFTGSKDRQDVITKQYGSQILSVYDEFGLSFLLDFIRFKNTVSKPMLPENLVEFKDFNVAIHYALEQACEGPDRVTTDKDNGWLSKLYYFKKDVLIPKNYNDQIRLLMTLRPLLQEAVSNTRLLESSYTVDGPLTWKTFHRLAGRGNHESCEPQPLPRFQVFCGKHSSKETGSGTSSIPGLAHVPADQTSSSSMASATTASGSGSSLQGINQGSTSAIQAQHTMHLQFPGTTATGTASANNGFITAPSNLQVPRKTGSLSYFSIEGNPLCLTNGFPEKDKECLTISPYAVREWDKLNLEPIFRPKEVAYAIVTPTDSSKVLQKALITYFKELNHAYQSCRLGHHFSYMTEALKDDIHSSFIEINTEYWNDKNVASPDKNCLQPPSLHKNWTKELSKVMPVASAEEFINKLVWYVKQCELQTVTTLGQYGVHKRNGTKSSLFPTCDGQKRDNATVNVNQTLELLLSPGNGCGPLSKVLNTKIWSSDKDVYLVVYLINPFTHGQDISEPTYRLSNQLMNKLCYNIGKNLHPAWKNRITFQLISINKIFDATQFGANVGVGDNDGSSIGSRDPSATSATSCTSSSVSWSVKWCRQWNWKSTAFAVYSSVRRKIGRVAGLQTILNGKNNSPNLCSSAKCSMARGCSSDDECESAASLINANRCQTKCGPTAFNEKLTVDYLRKFFLESQDQLNKSQNALSIYAPPYILAPPKSLSYHNNQSSSSSSSGQSNHTQSASASESWGYVGDKSNVLFVAYCLSVDQKWLLATCTDLIGTVQRHVQINIMVPQLHLRKKASPRRIGLGKLWDFVQEVVADSCQPWRVVIGRLGRAGHGELKSWNGLLSRQNLIRVNQRYRDECAMCHVWSSNGGNGAHGGVGPGGPGSGQMHSTGAMGTIGRCDMCVLQIPTIVSGCFVSLECHSSFRIFPGSVKPEERPSSNLPLCTPRDVSVTHILVFPTSTSAGALQNDQDLSGVGGGVNEMNLEELLKFGNDGIEEFGPIGTMDMTEHFSSDYESFSRIQGLGGLMSRGTSVTGGGGGGPGGGPGIGGGGGGGAGGYAMNSIGGGGGGGGGEHNGPGMDPGSLGDILAFTNQEDGHILMQQPLAMGYYLSTTDPGPLPPWFWSSCPPQATADSALPSCFKAALHLQTSLISQEDGGTGFSGTGGPAPHPLDSHQTCDVLRFVLESYHCLSWLTFDPSINDRRSCLPLHFLLLCQLYEADDSFM